jgi:hypothetical protein
MDIRAAAKCPETICSGYQERQCGVADHLFNNGDRISAENAPDLAVLREIIPNA